MFAVFAFPAPSYADLAGGCDFAPTGTTPSCLGPLTGSTFQGGDGNLLVSTGQVTDWANVGGLNAGIDKPSGGGDNSFGQGTKEDSPNVSVVSGSIPPQKSDLTRFYEASETGSNGHQFLYLAWERTNSLGSANMDFEINSKTQPDLTTTGAKTLNRTAGDLLITFDFTNGGGRPTIGLNRWLVSASNPVVPGFATNVCLSSNSFPCWGDHATLTGTIAIGAVNNLGSVTDPIPPNAPQSIAANRFGETAIDLTNSGVFGTGTCNTFASTFLKSRASASFPAEVKDFVAPVPTEISNCGRVTIIKHTDPSGIDQDFGFTSDVTGTTTADPASAACPTGSYNLNDGDPSTNTNDCFNVPVGDYTVTEGANPTGFAFEGLTCDATTGSSGTPSGKVASIHLIADGHVTCTYVNQQQLGAIKITKVSSKAAATALSGAHFELCTNNGPYTQANPCAPAKTGSGDLVTGNDGTVCVDNLGFGDYYVTETSPPTGYAADDTTTHKVTVDNNATCSDSPYGGEGITFNDTPLTDVVVSATSEVAGGTQSTITCTPVIGNSPQGPAETVTVTANGLKPGTYNCQIFIDP